MKVLIVEVRSEEEITAIMSRVARQYRFAAIPRTFPRGKVRWPGVYAFPDINALLRIMLAPNRLAIINALTGQGSMSIRALTRKVERHYNPVSGRCYWP